MDTPDSTTKNIRKMLSEVSKSLQMKMEGLRKDITDIKKLQQEQERDFSMQDSALLNVFDDLNRETQVLMTRRTMLKKSLEKEEADLGRLEKENQEFQRQVDNLEGLNRCLKDRRDEAEEKHRILQQKLQLLRSKTEVKESEHKEVNMAYKKYLGFDIIRVRENVIKIVYYNLGHECYIMLDFTNQECVVESQPDVSLDKLNYAFKERENFYEFFKRVREILKQQL